MIVRCLLDTCSQITFLRSDVAERLGCELYPDDSAISGVCDAPSFKAMQTSLRVHSMVTDYSVAVTCNVVKNITANMPQFSLRNEVINIPPNIQLADDSFDISSRIDILLASHVFFQALLPEQIPALPSKLVLQNTRFGFIVAGLAGCSSAAPVPSLASNFCCQQLTQNNDEGKLDNIVSQFWLTEKVPETYTEASSEQELAETIFQETVVLKDNKFEVALPLKQNIIDLYLGDSLSCALKRFLNLELRFKKDNELYSKYKAFIDEYVRLGHARYVNISEYNLEGEAVYFLAHHPIFNPSSKTSSLRVVFDGSMPTLAKISLNDVLLNGSVVQNDLFSILVLFRLYKFILNCDIQKMFRAISLTPEHRPLQNILWRKDKNSDIQCLQLQTVSYGLKSSSFLAIRCLLELVNRYKNDYPLAADALLYNTYVDDVNLVANDMNQILSAKTQLIALLRLGGFELHKWCSNVDNLLDDIPLSSQTKAVVDFSNEKDPIVKTLGIRCDLASDTIIMVAPKQEVCDNYTKRSLLSFVSRLFDPLGLVGPAIVNAKLLLQQTWLEKLQWNSPLPDHLNEGIKRFATSLNKMKSIVVKRNLDTSNAKTIDIIGYADASVKAHGCCLYLRIVNLDDSVSVGLLCSKSRVNPIQKLSIPRAELNAALLLAKLVKKVYDLIKDKFEVKVYLFLDSQVVLCWLATSSLKLNVYVANRVKYIQETTQDFSWYYVPTEHNPADLLSRGVDPHLLQGNNLWFYGPTSLKTADFLPKTGYEIPREIPELRVSHVTEKSEPLPLFIGCSNIDRIKRIVSYMYRFVNNCKVKLEDRLSGNLTPEELDLALKIVLRWVQAQYFAQEIKALNSKSPLKSNLQALNPFLDNMHLMRVGGRLQHADVPYATKHPIILPKGCKLVHYLIEKEHRVLLHAGAKLVLSDLSLRYHIINGIREVKCVINKCIICFKLKAKNAEQLMGSLPYDRITPCRVFEKTGMDFGGPYNIKMLRVRKPVIRKAYILLFVCFTTKALHIELVSDLTTECFMNALKRFIARRNKPNIIYCDNASTYKGAQNKLNELYKLQSATDHKNAVELFAADQGISFKFIPSYSPVFGSLWEAGIKSVKYHLKRVVGETVLTYEELNSVIVQIEGICNSRPMTALPTTDVNETPYLSPAHFLTGAPLTTYPEKDCTKGPVSLTKFWEQCNRMVQNFWKQWHKQYLVQLQNRPKWRKDCKNIEVDTLVIVKDDNVTPLRWPMARVVEVYPGVDGKVRALSIRTIKGSIIRTSIYKVCVLPIDS
ncbi:uncharacterized protein LOC134670736 isoform X1 [Cydia fagiglandana]|uniref:uncharacterized protein LOC134670736 isoform X1 n=1 Tax=Cydia fagiglandana TaxID=1458189 RepID=UPI002FEE1315